MLLAAAVVLGGSSFCQRTNAQTASPVGIDPATGLPRPGATGPRLLLNRSDAIDPDTGLPLPPPPLRSAPREPAETSALSLLSRARELQDQGRFKEALQCYLSYHIQVRASVTNGCLTAALSGWIELGQKYSKAKQALLDIRDNDTREFVKGRGSSEIFSELADINAANGEKDATCALFLGLAQSDPPLARDCYLIIEPTLVERGEYALCARYMGTPQARFYAARQAFEMIRGMAQDMDERIRENARRLEESSRTNHFFQPIHPISTSGPQLKAATDCFVGNMVQLLEILVGTGRQAEAEKLRAQALATLDEPRLLPTISDVEAKVRAVQASLRPAPAPIAIPPQFAESATLFPAKLPEPSASAERWSPELHPGVKPDMNAVLGEAKDLAAYDHYEEALQRYLWYYNHALEYDPEKQRGVRLSSALSDWVALGREYPKAREALREIRDRDLYTFGQGQGSATLFKNIAAIDEHIGHKSTTSRLFKHLNDTQPELARRCYPAAEDALVEEGDYALCLAYVGDGQARFKQHRQNWERLSQWEQHIGQMYRQNQQKIDDYWTQKGTKRPAGLPRLGLPPSADNFLVNDTCQLIEILVCAGHKPDAEAIRTQALALVDDPRLQSAVTDAEKKLGR